MGDTVASLSKKGGQEADEAHDGAGGIHRAYYYYYYYYYGGP